MTAPAAVPAAQLLFGDLDHELANTRRILERVPDGRGDWQPHEKSMTLGKLAAHLAELPRFPLSMLQTDDLDLSSFRFGSYPTTADLLAAFDEGSAALRAALAAADYDALAANWTLRMGDQVLLQGPRGALVRGLGINHLVHHRAQLGVYLRLLGIPIPGLYGPSADEQ